MRYEMDPEGFLRSEILKRVSNRLKEERGLLFFNAATYTSPYTRKSTKLLTGNIGEQILKLILPHHRFHGKRRTVDVFGGRLLVVHSFYVALYVEIDKLADRHPRVDANGLGNGNF